MTAIACSRLVRDSTIASPAIRQICRRRQVHRAFRHRCVGDQQGQARGLESCGPDAGGAARLLDYGKAQGFKRDWSAWHRHCDELRVKYAMNYDRNSALIQPYYVIEEINRLTRGEAIITTGVGQHQMWAAQYFDFRSPRLWLTSGSMGTMGFGLAGGRGRAVRATQPPGHRHRRRCQHPHEYRRAGNRHHLRSARQSGGAQQLRRRHGQAMAEAVPQGPPERQRQEPAHQGFRQGGAGRRLQIRGAARQKADVPRVIEEFIRFQGPHFSRS